MNVVHVTLSMDCGGQERMILDLVRLGLQRGQRSAVICLERPGQLAGQLGAIQVPVICMHKLPGLRWGLCAKLQEELLEIRPDVVHTHQIGSLFYAGRAARKAGVPVVIHTEHGKHFQTRRRTRILGRLASREATTFVCVSHDIAQEVESCNVAPARKLTVIPNGVDVAKFQNLPNTAALKQSLGIPVLAPVVGTIGRLEEIKRQDLLITAFDELAAKLESLHLVIVGDGQLRKELHDQASCSEYADRIHLVGYQADPQNYLAIMNVFALPSRSEGTPLSVLEAWAAGVPVVASRVGGLPEMLGEDEAGLLIEPGVSTELCGAILRIVSDEHLRKRLTTEALRRVSCFYSDRTMVDRYDDIYRQSLQMVRSSS